MYTCVYMCIYIHTQTYIYIHTHIYGYPDGSDSKESACNAGESLA